MASTISVAVLLPILLSIWNIDLAYGAVDCSSLVLNMADCLSFVSSGSTVAKPEGSCCSGLKTVLKADAQCLCEAFKNSASLGVTLNVSKALTLPSACNVNAPSATSCGLSAMSVPPAAAPVSGGSPAGSVGGPAMSPGGDMGAPAPAPAPGDSASSALSVPFGSLIVFGLGAALFSTL